MKIIVVVFIAFLTSTSILASQSEKGKYKLYDLFRVKCDGFFRYSIKTAMADPDLKGRGRDYSIYSGLTVSLKKEYGDLRPQVDLMKLVESDRSIYGKRRRRRLFHAESFPDLDDFSFVRELKNKPIKIGKVITEKEKRSGGHVKNGVYETSYIIKEAEDDKYKLRFKESRTKEYNPDRSPRGSFEKVVLDFVCKTRHPITKILKEREKEREELRGEFFDE